MRTYTLATFAILTGLLFQSTEARPAHKAVKPKKLYGAALAKKIDAGVPSYRVIERDIFDRSSQGGELKAYFKEDDVVRMDISLRDETKKTETSYYLSEGKLGYVRETIQEYSGSIGSQDWKIVARKKKEFIARAGSKYDKEMKEFLDLVRPREKPVESVASEEK
jgi:hypothetical protein